MEKERVSERPSEMDKMELLDAESKTKAFLDAATRDLNRYVWIMWKASINLVSN